MIAAILRENSVSGNSTLRADRAAGIIYGVKVLGKSSPNTHGVAGVEGTDYTPGAMAQARPLYEGLKVNIDHPPREKPGKDRSAYDRLGKICNTRIEDGEIFGDLHLLKSHPMAERVMEAAEKMPDAFGLSHNAYGKGSVIGKRYVISSIPEVRSVDVVADAGTTRGLFESQENPMSKKTLKAVLENLKIPAKAIKRIWEMDGMAPTMAADAEPEAPPDAEDEDYETHLGRCIVSIVNDEELSPEEKKKKVLAAVKLLGEEEEGGDGEGDGKGETDVADEESEEEGADKKKIKDDMECNSKESLEFKLSALERKDAVRSLCESEAFLPSPLQIKALLGLESDKDRKAFIQEARGKKPSANGKAPRSSSAYTPILEGAEPKDSKEFAGMLLR